MPNNKVNGALRGGESEFKMRLFADQSPRLFPAKRNAPPSRNYNHNSQGLYYY